MSNWENRIGGFIPSEVDPRDYRLCVTYGTTNLPEEYNAKVRYNVHDQGSYNNCAAHSLSSYVEILLKSNDAFKEVSFPWYYGDRNYTENKDKGLVARDLLKTAQKDGGLYLSDYSKVEEMKAAMNTFNSKFPSLKSKAQNLRLGNYYKCNTVDEVKEAVYKYGAVLIGTYLFKSFSKVANGETLYMTEPIVNVSPDGKTRWTEDPVGGHMMVIVGWIRDYFVVQNSWGTSFGDGGYFYMPFSLSTWSERYGFPISLFEAWAIDGMYINNKFTSFKSGNAPAPTPEPDPEPKPTPTPGFKKDWKKTPTGEWIYVIDENGSKAKGWQKIDGVWYHLDERTGYMDLNKWIPYNDKMCYVRADGQMVNKAWRRIDNAWYWFDENGYAAKGYKNIDGVDYYFADKAFGKIKEYQCLEISK